MATSVWCGTLRLSLQVPTAWDRKLLAMSNRIAALQHLQFGGLPGHWAAGLPGKFEPRSGPAILAAQEGQGPARDSRRSLHAQG